jgi:hypothetical protein
MLALLAVSGGADYSMNMPMIVPYDYKGWAPERWLEHSATKNLMDRYFYKHGRYLMGADRSLDLFTMALALDILEDYDQPDAMLIKMCDLDSCRHTYGSTIRRLKSNCESTTPSSAPSSSPSAARARSEETNIVILGDHGMTDVRDALLLNVLLRKQGFLKTDGKGNIVEFDAVAHSTGLGAYVELGDPGDSEMKQKVWSYLKTLMEEPDIQLEYVMDSREAMRTFGRKARSILSSRANCPLRSASRPRATISGAAFAPATIRSARRRMAARRSGRN